MSVVVINRLHLRVPVAELTDRIADAAREGAAAIGPTVFNDLVVPNLAGEQDRVVGPVVVALSPGVQGMGGDG
jgi:hypothetical protein